MSMSELALRLSAEMAPGFETTMNRGAAAVDKIGREADKTTTSLERTRKSGLNMGADMERGLKITAAAVAGLGVAAGKMSVDFDTAFSRAVGLAGLAKDSVDETKGAVLALAAETGRGPQELAEAFYFVASAGFTGAKALEVLEASAKGAAAGLGTTQSVADGLTSVIGAYGEANITAAEATDVLVQSAREGKVEAADLAPQLGRLLPLATTLGVSFGELGGMLAFLSRTSGDASISSTQLLGIMRSLFRPSEMAAKALDSVHLSAQDLREMVGEQGLAGTLQTLNERFDGNQDKLGKVFQDTEALSGAMLILNDNSGNLAGVLERTENATGALDEAFGEAASTNGFKFRQAMAELQVALIKIGDVVVPIAASVASAVAKVASAFSDLPAPIQKVIIALIAMAGAGAAIVLVTDKMLKFQTAASTASGKVTTLASTYPRLTGALLGVAAAYAIINVATSIWADTAERARETSERLQGEYERLSEAIKQGGADVGAGVDSYVKTEIAAKNMTDTLNDMGASVQDVSRAITLGGLAYEGLKQGIDTSTDSGQKFSEWLIAQRGLFQRNSEAAVRAALADEKVGKAGLLAAAQATQSEAGFQAFSKALDDNVIAANELDRVNMPAILGAIAGSAAGAVPPVGALGDAASGTENALAKMAQAAIDAFNATSSYSRAGLSTSGAIRGLSEAQDNVATKGASAAKGLHAAGGAASSAGDSALDAERKMRTLADAELGVEDAARGVEDSHRGVEAALRAVDDATRGVDEAERGVTDAHRGVEEAAHRTSEAMRSEQASVRGVADAAKDLQDATDRLAKAQTDATKRASEQAEAQQNLQDVLAAESGDAREKAEATDRQARRAAIDLTDAQEKQASVQSELNDYTEWYGANSPEAVDAAKRLALAQLDLEDAQFRSLDTTRDATKAQGEYQAVLADPGSSEKAREAADKVATAQGAVADSARQVSDATDAITTAQIGVDDANHQVEESHRAVEEAQRAETEAARAVTEADRAVIDAHRRVDDANRDVEKSNRDVEAALRGVETANFRVREAEEARTASQRGGGGGGGGGIQATWDQAAAEDELKGRLLDVEDALRGEIDAAGARAEFVAGPGATADEIELTRMGLRKEAYDKIIERYGAESDILAPGSELRQHVDDYASQLGLIPADRTTNLQVNATDAADKLAAFADTLEGIRDSSFGTDLPGIDGLISTLRDRATRMRRAAQADALHEQVVTQLANGGVEEHVAHIAPAGAWRVFAEPETGGEGYIPLAMSKRGRSTAILGDIAGRFGYSLTSAANGWVSGGNVNMAGVPGSGGDDFASALRALAVAMRGYGGPPVVIEGVTLSERVDLDQFVGRLGYMTGSGRY